MNRITKEFLCTNNFKSAGIIFYEEQKNFRLNPSMNLPPSAGVQCIKLRKKFITIFAERYKNYSQFESRCSISESLMRKYLKGTRKITREAVAKICIGTKLSLEESAELFTLQGHSLEPETQLFDAIIVNAIQDGDDIEDFFDTCEEFGIQIF